MRARARLASEVANFKVSDEVVLVSFKRAMAQLARSKPHDKSKASSLAGAEG